MPRDFHGIDLVTRSEAGLRAPKRTTYLPARNVVESVLHHGGDGSASPTVDDQLRRWGGYQRYHMRSKLLGGRGWSDIAYNYGLLLDGRLVEGRGHTVEGGATGGGVDDRSVSVCAIGNYDTEQAPTDAQIATMRHLNLDVWPTLFPNYRGLNGHHDYGKQACPGSTFRVRWAEMTTPTPTTPSEDDMAGQASDFVCFAKREGDQYPAVYAVWRGGYKTWIPTPAALELQRNMLIYTGWDADHLKIKVWNPAHMRATGPVLDPMPTKRKPARLPRAVDRYGA